MRCIEKYYLLICRNNRRNKLNIGVNYCYKGTQLFFIPLPHRSRDHCVRGWHAQRPRLVRSLFLDCKSSVRNTNSHALLCLLAVKLSVYVSQEPSTFIFNSHLHVKNDGVLSPVQKKKVERKEKYGQWMVIEIFVLFIITVGLLDTDWQVWI